MSANHPLSSVAYIGERCGTKRAMRCYGCCGWGGPGTRNWLLEPASGRAGGGSRMSLTRINKTGKLPSYPWQRRTPHHLRPDPNQAAQRDASSSTLPGGEVGARPWDAAPTPVQLALARGHRWLATDRVRRGKVPTGDRPDGGRGQQLREPDG